MSGDFMVLSFLAFRTVITGATADLDLLNRALADPARFAFSAIDLEVYLKITAFLAGIDKITDR